MSDKLDIEKLFQDKFQNFEPDVSSDVWANVSENIGTSATGASGMAAKTGMSVWMKTAIISGGILVASVAGIYVFTEDQQENVEDNQAEEVSQIDRTEEDNAKPIIEIISGSDMDSAIDNKKEIEEELNELKDEVKEYDENISERVVIKMDEVRDEPLINLGELIDEVEVELGLNNKTDQNDTSSEEKQDDETDQEETTNTDASTEEGDNIGNDDVFVEDNEEERLQENGMIVDNSINVFTPDNDGVNDFWSVKTKNVESLFIQIRNKKGEIVFESNDKEFSWDGRNIGNEPVEDGAYTYTIVAKGDEHESIVKRGLVYVR